LETSNAKLQESNTELQEELVTVQGRLVTVERENVELGVTLRTTMEAIIGVSTYVCSCVSLF
jgi:hypothetical protein